MAAAPVVVGLALGPIRAQVGLVLRAQRRGHLLPDPTGKQNYVVSASVLL